MTAAVFAADAIAVGSPAGRRISLQHAVVTFLLIEVALLFLCGIAPRFYLEAFGASAVTQEQFEAQLEAAAIGVVVYLICARLYPVYSPSLILDARLNIKRLILVVVATFSTLVAIAAANKTTQNYSRLWFHVWAISALELLLLARLCGVMWVKGKLQRGACIFRALSIGLGARPLTNEQLLLYSSNQTRTVRCYTLAATADIEALAATIRNEGVDQVYISAPWNLMPDLARKITKLRFLAVDIFLYCDEDRLRGEVLNVRDLGAGLAFQAGFCPIAGWDRLTKRVEDIVASLLGLALTSPLLALTAIAIRLESPGPIFFRQTREGLNGTHFELLKFRSMHADKTDPHATKQTSQNDDRVTRVGRIIRRLSIDELPQLFNVLEGSMSLVGPRPHALRTRAEGRALEEVVDYYASRHRVKSGITGWAQVNGLRGELDSIEKLKARVDHDLYYIQNWSIWFDIKIMMRTASLVLFDRKAY